MCVLECVSDTVDLMIESTGFFFHLFHRIPTRAFCKESDPHYQDHSDAGQLYQVSWGGFKVLCFSHSPSIA